ncbi:integrase [Vibrio tarriae]|uniref:Mu transposase C-terminal domain-containing protein n=1 Tax=Vibrio tarriae TaxID=2014742 RepID=UPI000DE328F6|nr:Mu transposase C-terminal domain-containing protein [Vibrio tarriae]RBM48469.1 integrase [Vibrio tarriae]
MKLASLHTGLHLTLNDVPFMISRILEGGECYLERRSDLAIVKRMKQELMTAFYQGELIIHGKSAAPTKQARSEIDLSGLDYDCQQAVLRKYHYIKLARDLHGNTLSKNHLGDIIRVGAESLGDENPPSVPSVYRWWRSWKASSYDIRVLVNKPSGSKGMKKLKGVVAQVFDEVVEEVYLTPQRASIQATYDAFLSRVSLINVARQIPLKVPSRSTFYRLVRNANKYEVMSARYGKSAADKAFRASGLGARPTRILERIEVDHTPMDVHVLNPITGVADGRPYLTLLLDRYSRMPVGMEIGFEPPSELSVMRALRNAILPKSYIKQYYPDIEHEWPAFGTPVMLICDNGMEFHSQQLRRMCGELDIDLQFCPKAQPQYKGAVERFLGTLNRQVSHRIPGTSFSNINQRGDYDSVKQSSITLEDLKELVHQWMIDIYCQKTHRGTQRTPAALWNEGLKAVEPMLPESKEQLDLILTSEDERVLSHTGIEFKGLFYNSAELTLIRHLGDCHKVRFRYDKENLGFIWVYDEHEGNFLKVPCIDSYYATGLTLRQHLQIRADARERGASEQEMASLIRSKEKFRQKIEQKSKHRLLRERRKAARDNSEALNKQPNQSAWTANSVEPVLTLGATDNWDNDDIPVFSVIERTESK